VPYMLMADLGAEVIKIEVPDGGDTSRVSSVLPGHPSSFFETNNRGVKSVTLNLKAPEGREILRKLVARADIFGQNFRLDLLFYPPIAVLIVDTMHTVASKID